MTRIIDMGSNLPGANTQANIGIIRIIGLNSNYEDEEALVISVRIMESNFIALNWHNQSSKYCQLFRILRR